MKKEYFVYILIYLFTLSPDSSYAQYNEAVLWTNISLEKQLTKKISVVLMPQVRVYNNWSNIKYINLDIGADYKLSKSFTIGANYRLINAKANEGYFLRRHRFLAEVDYSRKLKKFSVSLKTKLQILLNEHITSDANRLPRAYIRNRLGIKYLLSKKVSFSLAQEMLFQLNNPIYHNTKYAYGRHFSWSLTSAGINLKLNKANSVSFSYLIMKGLNMNNPPTYFVISIGYTHKFK